jgi:CheY-like chemotaxis protein
MDSFDVTEHHIHELLQHLYDPTFRPPESLWKTVHIERERGIAGLREAVLSSIENLKPGANAPTNARSWRIYNLLHFRYVEGLSQEVTAEKLGITSRHLRRSVAEAVYALSLDLWEAAGHAPPVYRIDPSANTPSDAGSPAILAAPPLPQPLEPEETWQSQLLRELAALGGTADGAISDIAETIAGILRLAAHLTSNRGITMVADPGPLRLSAAIHPSALRHLLLTVIDQLTRQMTLGEIRLGAASHANEVHVSVVSTPLTAPAIDDLNAIREMLSSFGINTEVNVVQDSVRVTIRLLQVDRCVLVVDDNLDMAHLYRRYLAGTRYFVQHTNRGEQMFELINLHQPDLVVLDVMLPDVDGWDLLIRLHDNPDTRLLPVLICSVMQERALAHALGARDYLTKPVQRQDFIRALDAILHPGSSRSA